MSYGTYRCWVEYEEQVGDIGLAHTIDAIDHEYAAQEAAQQYCWQMAYETTDVIVWVQKIDSLNIRRFRVQLKMEPVAYAMEVL